MTHTHLTTRTLTLLVNGDRRDVPEGTTLGALLAGLGLDPKLIVVEHNREIRRDRDAYDAVALADGDVLELVHFVGGG